MQRDGELSIKPTVLLLLVATVLAAVASVLAFEAVRATTSQSGSAVASTGSSFRELDVSQDRCKTASFALASTGQAQA